MIEEIRENMFNSEHTPEAFKELFPKMLKDRKPAIGKLRPLVWEIEPTLGCNLRCGHCATRTFTPGQYKYMSMDTWYQFLEVAKEVAPMARLEFAQAGEPTLNPNFKDMMKAAKEVCPTLQTMVYTNGTTLKKGMWTYKELFEAGLNMVLVDVYGKIEPHEKLAKESGYRWGYRYKCEDDGMSPFNYYGDKDPDLHYICLGPNPEEYAAQGRKNKMTTMLSTFFNKLDWKAAAKFGMKPVTKPPRRRCSQPFKMPVVRYDGSYTFCCFDFTREVEGIGNVSEGVEGFFRYWMGEYMQDVRARLDKKDRESHPLCKLCNFCTNRCDIPMWPEDALKHYWNGETWVELDYEYVPPVDPQRKLF